MKYNQKIVSAFFEECGVPAPVYELRFHAVRRWRFDICWPKYKVALEVQGGLFYGGRHTRGAALLKEYEKLNHAAMDGWRVMFVTPNELCMTKTVDMIRASFAG